MGLFWFYLLSGCDVAAATSTKKLLKQQINGLIVPLKEFDHALLAVLLGKLAECQFEVLPYIKEHKLWNILLGQLLVAPDTAASYFNMIFTPAGQPRDMMGERKVFRKVDAADNTKAQFFF